MTYVSHLDVQRAFARSIIKSKLPVYYTEGFNPIPKLTFASPLSVGCSGKQEYAQIKLVEDLPDEIVLERLRQAMPPDIHVLEVYTPTLPFKQIAWAENTIDFYNTPVAADTLEKLQTRFDGPVIVTKRTKSSEKETDIRPLIRDIHFSIRADGGLRITAVTCGDNTNYLNPDYVARVCAEIADPAAEGYYTICRERLLLADGSVFR